MNTTHLIIVVPCYNEESVLPETIRQLSGVLNRMLENGKISIGKILFVDDGSKDKTWEIITEAGKTNGLVGGLKLAHNSGHQYALLAGLEWASTHCDAAISIDADLQDDVDAIEEMTDCFLQGADIVYGVRRERTTDTWFKKNTALLFYQLIRKMGSDVVYNHADFRLMSKRALQALVSYPERNLFLRGIVRLIGFPEAYVYYDRKSRFAGESKYPFKKMLSGRYYLFFCKTASANPDGRIYFRNNRPHYHDYLRLGTTCSCPYHTGLDLLTGLYLVYRWNDYDGYRNNRNIYRKDLQRSETTSPLFYRRRCQSEINNRAICRWSDIFRPSAKHGFC